MKPYSEKLGQEQLDKIKRLVLGQGRVQAKRSLDWFYRELKGLKHKPPRAFFDAKKDIFIGGMLFFVYDPKHKETLPYYDKFPLVIPIGTYPDGFLGLNLHYLPPAARAELLSKLIKYRIGAKTTNAYMQVSYGMLKDAIKHPLFMPCVKRYLYSHVRSKFAAVNEIFWADAVMLPVQKFEKKSAEQVWASYRHKKK